MEPLRGCPDSFASDGGRALIAWLHTSCGFQIEGEVGAGVEQELTGREHGVKLCEI